MSSPKQNATSAQMAGLAELNEKLYGQNSRPEPVRPTPDNKDPERPEPPRPERPEPPRPERPEPPERPATYDEPIREFTPMDPTPYVKETRQPERPELFDRPGPYAPDKRIPIPKKMFDMDDYMSMGKLAQMGYKKGGAVKAASGKSNGNADKSGRLNLGSSRVSTAVKSKKNPNF